MSKPNYLQHEDQYRHLRMNGFQGWGGETLENRMAGWQATIDTLLSSGLFPKKGARLLELGSGAGDSLIPLAESGYHVTGIEISPTAVQWAGEKFQARNLDARFVQGSVAEPLPFKDSTFDGVLDAACLHCLTDDDRRKAFLEALRVLKPGGFFLVSHMVNDPRELTPGTVFNAATRSQERGGIPYRSMPTYEHLRKDVESTGFKILHQSLRQNAWWDHAELWCLKN